MRSLRQLAAIARQSAAILDSTSARFLSHDGSSALISSRFLDSIIASQTSPRETPFPSLLQGLSLHLRSYAKAAKNNKSGKSAAAASSSSPSSSSSGDDSTLDLSPFKNQMNSAIEHLQHELANIRTGRATPGMLDHLKIEAYGDRVPMKAVGSVSVRDPQLLVVTLFDPALVDAVVSGIAQSPLRLNPRAEGQEVLVPVPPPTAETLNAMSKMCKSEGETAKVSIRHARKLALDAVKAINAEDVRRRLEKEVQNITDKFIAEIDQYVGLKQKDIAKHNS